MRRSLANADRASRRLELHLLELFETIFRTSNLTVAGEALGLSQPAVSRGLARLRGIYDDPLFVRQQRGVRPTPFAQQLFEPVVTALDMVRGTVEKPVFVPRDERRSFNLAMSDIGERYFMSRLIRHLSSVAPNVAVEVVAADRAAFLAGLGSGDIDMGVGYFPDLGKQVRVRRLFTEHFVYVARRGHPRIKGSIEIADLKHLQHVLANPPGTQHATTVQRVLRGRRIHAPVMYELCSFLCVGPIVSETDVVSVVPLNLAKLVAEHLQLQILPPPVRFPSFEVSMVWHQRFDREEGSVWLRDVFAGLFKAAN
ncbi:MAG: LysR family transcriptional regulator [Burkholderiales bacterium]|nr:LysR family transcriptional regulator [Burkholderiales bacterium]